jgi:hypothetical protein
MRLLSSKDVPPGQYLKCSECHSKAPIAITVAGIQADGSSIKLCGACISKAWELYWGDVNQESVENFNTNLETDINKEVFPR